MCWKTETRECSKIWWKQNGRIKTKARAVEERDAEKKIKEEGEISRKGNMIKAVDKRG